MNLALTAWIGPATILVVSSVVCSAFPDKSGVNPTSISLPSGPGSIEGLGESFEPQLNSGTFSYRIPLKLPPVRGGAPTLSLEYSSGAGNGPLGLGWQLKLPCVRRQTDKGLPQYRDTDLFIDENAEELVALADDSYRQKIESAFIRYERSPGGTWIGRLRNGSVLRFGESPASRLDWSTNRTYCWMIESSEDRNGNRTEYRYRHDSQQIYLDEIRYGLHITMPSETFSVRFSYETNRNDAFVDCRPRFASTNRLRLQSITALLGERRIRQWQFAYHTNSPVSLLASVTMFGDNRSQTNDLAQANRDFLPPTRFDYTPFAFPAKPQMKAIVFDPQQPNFAFDAEDGGAGGTRAEFVDINHDGLPDILINSDDRWSSLINPGPSAPRWSLALPISNPPPVTGAALGRNTTRLVDLRGDGKSKLLIAQSDQPGDAATAFYYYDFKTPTLLEEPKPYTTGNGMRLGDANAQLLDLDNDKAMDLLATDTGPFGGLNILFTRSTPAAGNQYLNAGNPHGLDFADRWQLADINGDRLQDFVRLLDRDNIEVCLNLGWGVFGPRTLITGGPTANELQPAGSSGPQLVDLNQDGLADLVIVDNGRVRVWLNVNGQRWANPIEFTNGIPAYQQGEDIVRFADINGNGTVDIVWHHRQDTELHYLDLFPDGKAFLLKHVETTLGRTLDLAYRSSIDYMTEAAGTTNKWTSVAPFPVPVVAQIVEGDGLGNRYTNQISYRNAYYDGLEREFRGFEQAMKRELGDDNQGAPKLLTRFAFDTGATNEALKGKPLAVEAMTEAGGIFYRQTNEWSPRPLKLDVASSETRSITFAFQNRKRTQEIELAADSDTVTLEEEFDYDNFGNQIRHADYGRVENGVRSEWDDERVSVRQFSAAFPSGANSWLLDRVVQEELQDENGKVIARSQHFYDDEKFAGNNSGVVSKGNLTMLREWIDIATNAFRATTRNEYDPFGNITISYDPLGVPGRRDLGHLRHMAFDDRIHTHPVRETIYTANPDAKAAGEAEPSLAAMADYDVGLGALTGATDFNLNRTAFDFDTFGRIVAITKPYDSTNLPTAQFRYTLQSAAAGGGTLNWTESRLREISGQAGTFDSRSYFDGMGRKLMTRTESESNGVAVVTEAKRFNQRRGDWKSFLPYFETGSLDFQPGAETNAFVETHYDALSRPLQVFQPLTPTDVARPFSRTTYAPLSRLIEDEEQTRPGSPHAGAAMRYVEDGLRDKDGKGRLRTVQEIVKLTDEGLPSAAANVWTTTYRYDLLDNFLGYTDSQNNQKEFRYDALSRKTFMDDPDRGHMTWSYDEASNLRSTLDSKSQTISYEYDGVNRLLTEHYRPTNQPPDVTYHYDSPFANLPVGDGTTATASNTKGMLAWVKDLSGEEHTSYDARSRVEFVVKRIADPVHGQLVSFRTAFAYDSLDRVTALTYPDSDQVGYLYNARNLLTRITGGPSGSIITNITYRASDQLAQIDYGNSIRTTYKYDPRLRLNSLFTHHTSRITEPLIDFSYEFDGVSNIKSIADNRPTSAIPLGNPRRNTQVFAYDDLYRITRATYNPSTLDVQFSTNSVAYRYDRIGNMLGQTSDIGHSEKGFSVTDLGAMHYGGGDMGRSGRVGRKPNDPPGPHALTSITNPKLKIANRLYPYDANGNMQTIDGLACTWDFKDRLVAVENAQMRADYTYDYTDRRITKRVVPKLVRTESTRSPTSSVTEAVERVSATVLYPNKYFELREDGAPVKYVWNGDTRVARVTGSLTTNRRTQRLRVYPGWNLVSIAINLVAADVRRLILSDQSLVTSPAIIESLQRWSPVSSDWVPVTMNESLPAGTVLWLKSSTNATVQVAGAYTDPVNRTAPIGASFQPGAGLEAWPFTNAPPNLVAWKFDSPSQTWLVRHGTNLPGKSDFPATLAAGEGFMARADASTTLEVPESALQLRYYHQDHLGSSSVLTDAAGWLVEETAYYPFGRPRQLFVTHGLSENYRFTQKELDAESSLYYFEARFLLSGFANFVSVDPIVTQFRSDSPVNPQKLNAYAYVCRRPTILHDPCGTEERPVQVTPKEKLADIVVGAFYFVRGAISAIPDLPETFAERVRTDIERARAIQNELAPMPDKANKISPDSSTDELQKETEDIEHRVERLQQNHTLWGLNDDLAKAHLLFKLALKESVNPESRLDRQGIRALLPDRSRGQQGSSTNSKTEVEPNDE